MPPAQSHRDVTVRTALGDDVLLFAGMHAYEELGRLSEYIVRLESLDKDIDIADVVSKPMNITLATKDNGKRHFDGIVTHFRATGWNGDFSTYEATMRPGLWLLTLQSDFRIFQGKNVVAIVQEMYSVPGSLMELRVALSGTYQPLPYCVQYRETDFDFVCRLLEEAGIYFYFTHTDKAHTMVLVDSQAAHQPIAGYEALPYRVAGTAGADAPEGVLQWASGGAITSGLYQLRTFNFEKPAARFAGSASVEPAYTNTQYILHDYPGNFVETVDGSAMARARIESLHAQGEQVVATTTARGLFPGGTFTLAEHPRTEANRGYLVTSMTFEVTGNGYASGARALTFSCRIGAIGKQNAFVPVPIRRKPVVQGPQTALVTGPEGEEIHTDRFGRIKVRFHWDWQAEAGAADDADKNKCDTSCWIRVAQGWAGKGWGTMAVPRVGMEVVVSFLDGDPDRPLVTGCVYNGVNPPPYDLPLRKTVSTTKSRSSTNGDGFNELRFDDDKGKEEVFLHAERDFLRVVKNNDALKVGFETADKGNQTIDIKNDQTIAIGHDALETIDNNQAVTIKADQKLDVGGNQRVGIDGDQQVKVGQTIVIEAGTSIELKVGGSSIKIEAGKITIKAADIEIAADANAKIKAGAMMEIKSGAPMTIAGAIVQIN